VRLVWGGAQRCLYVDGKPVAADTRKLGNLRFSGDHFHIGAGETLAADSFWSGLIDEVRIYNRALKP